MSKSIKIFDYAHECLRIAQEQREEEGWVNGSSLEQIASEAIIFWASHGDNSITKNIKDPEIIRKLLERF